MNTWFTADTHFTHENMRLFTNRKNHWDSMKEMDDALIEIEFLHLLL